MTTVLSYSRCLVLLLVLLTSLLAGCSRQALYDAAMDHERSAAGLVESDLDIDGRRIAYLKNAEPNNGATIILLHGFGANKENWLRMARELTGQYNVYAIDLPGHGDSNKDLDRDYSIEAQTGYVNEILDVLSLDRINMVGNSMGGAITARFAATYPDRVITATLLDPAGVFEYDSELVDRVRHGDNPLIVTQPGDFEKLVNFALEEKPFVPWPIYSVMEEKALANAAINQHIFAQIRDSGYQPAFRQALETIQAPVLIVWGREDRVINVRNADIFDAHIPRSKKIVLDGIGHAPMVEAPEKTAALVTAFIANPTP